MTVDEQPLAASPMPGGLDLSSVAAQVDKYRRLRALDGTPPGRTTARRDALRAVAERYPGALRERECLDDDGLLGRLRHAEAVAARLGAPAALGALAAAPEHAALRAAIGYQRWITAALSLRRRLLAGLPTVEAARALGLPLDFAARVADPPDGHVSSVAWAEASRESGIAASDLKACLFPRRHGAPTP